MLALLAQGRNHVSQGREGAVDVLCLLQSLTRGVGLANSFTTSQIDEMELALGLGAIDKVFTLDLQETSMNRQTKLVLQSKT